VTKRPEASEYKPDREAMKSKKKSEDDKIREKMMQIRKEKAEKLQREKEQSMRPPVAPAPMPMSPTSVMRAKSDLEEENKMKLNGYLHEADDILEMVLEDDDEFEYFTEKDDESVIQIEEDDPIMAMMMAKAMDSRPRGSIKTKKKKKNKIISASEVP